MRQSRLTLTCGSPYRFDDEMDDEVVSWWTKTLRRQDGMARDGSLLMVRAHLQRRLA